MFEISAQKPYEWIDFDYDKNFCFAILKMSVHFPLLSKKIFWTVLPTRREYFSFNFPKKCNILSSKLNNLSLFTYLGKQALKIVQYLSKFMILKIRFLGRNGFSLIMRRSKKKDKIPFLLIFPFFILSHFLVQLDSIKK